MKSLNEIHVLVLLSGAVRYWLAKTMNVDAEVWPAHADTTFLFDVDDTARADRIGRLFGLSLCSRVSVATTTDGRGHRVFTIVVDDVLIIVAVPRNGGLDMLPLVNGMAPHVGATRVGALGEGVDWESVGAAVDDLMFAYMPPTGLRHQGVVFGDGSKWGRGSLRRGQR